MLHEWISVCKSGLYSSIHSFQITGNSGSNGGKTGELWKSPTLETARKWYTPTASHSSAKSARKRLNKLSMFDIWIILCGKSNESIDERIAFSRDSMCSKTVRVAVCSRFIASNERSKAMPSFKFNELVHRDWSTLDGKKLIGRRQSRSRRASAICLWNWSKWFSASHHDLIKEDVFSTDLLNVSKRAESLRADSLDVLGAEIRKNTTESAVTITWDRQSESSGDPEVP